MNEAASRTDRRRVRNRAALFHAAETLFAERGTDAVSIDQIVGAADLAKGTFYNHFADKDALAREIARTVRGDAEARVELANAGVTDPAERVARALAVFTRFALECPARARVMTRLAPHATDVEAPLNRGLRSDVTTGIRAKRFAANRDTAGLFVMGVVQIAIARMVDEAPPPAAARVIATELATLMLRGLGLKNAEAERIAVRATTAVLTAPEGGSR